QHVFGSFVTPWSVSPGLIGATITPVGIPALRNCWIVSILALGGEVRGSRRRCNFASSEVTEMFTAAALYVASSRKKSISRDTSRFFVMIATGLRNRARTSRQPRVIRNFLSIG